MKNRIMLKLILIIVSILGCRLASAQDDYIVLTRGDTLYGKVKYHDFGADKKVQITEGKKKTTYSMLQVRSFFMDKEHYHLVRIGSKYQFMKPLMPDGYMTLYSFQHDNLISWDGRFLLKRDGAGMEVPNIGFKKKLSDFMTECPELVEGINSGDLGRNDIAEIVNRFNSCIETRSVPETIPAQPPAQPSAQPVIESRTWSDLEEGIRDSGKIEDKEAVIEMVAEVKSKVARNETIPRFLLDGLKRSLEPEPDLLELLSKALDEKRD
jgi:hypothetical protein